MALFRDKPCTLFMNNKYEEIITMKCEKCLTPTRSMVCLPRRRRKDGTAICFWQVCLKCAKEIINAKEHKIRHVSKVSQDDDAKSRQAKKSNVLRGVQRVVRGVKNGTKKIKRNKKTGSKRF